MVKGLGRCTCMQVPQRPGVSDRLKPELPVVVSHQMEVLRTKPKSIHSPKGGVISPVCLLLLLCACLLYLKVSLQLLVELWLTLNLGWGWGGYVCRVPSPMPEEKTKCSVLFLSLSKPGARLAASKSR